VAGRRSPVTEIREILRRLQLGEPDRSIARDLDVSRNTVARYRVWATRHGVLARGPLPDAATLAALLMPAPADGLRMSSPGSSFSASASSLHERGVEGQAIWQLLVEEHGFTGSYSAVKRFLRRHAPATPPRPSAWRSAPASKLKSTLATRASSSPEQSRVRRAWVFVMTLSFSRHQYAGLVFDQTIATWLRLHRAAFEFFGGVPHRVVLDNLRAAIVHASLHDPEVQRSYRECAEHYGFLIAPYRPRTPEHKPEPLSRALAGRAGRIRPARCARGPAGRSPGCARCRAGPGPGRPG
jgi:Integrase core domain